MYHYIRLTYDVPSFIRRFQAIDLLENYIYDHLEEFGCLPRDENVNKMIRESFCSNSSTRHEKEYVHINLMIRMTDEEAVKTAGDRSEFQHASPTDMDKSEKRALRKISKRKRAESSEGESKKMKSDDCLICLDELGERKTTTLDCDHAFHYRCIKRWLSIKKVCPVCNAIVDI